MREKNVLKGMLLALVLVLIGTVGISLESFAAVYVTPESVGSSDVIETVKITKNVTSIEDGSFSRLTSLKSFKVDKENKNYTSYGNYLYNKDCTQLICVPQNIKSVKAVKSSCTSCLPHALDGLSDSEKQVVTQSIAKNIAKTSIDNNKKTEEVLTAQVLSEAENKASNNKKAVTQTPKVDTSNNKSSTFTPRYKVNESTSTSKSTFTPRTKTNSNSSNTSSSKSSSSSSNKSSGSSNNVQNNIVNSQPVTNNVHSSVTSVPDSSKFQKYVYQEDGETCFKYTGSGDSVIVVPEGVTRIDGFTEDQHSFNNEITTVIVPSTIEAIMCSNMYYDGNFYSVLYQCPNLKNVTGGNVSYQCYGNYVMRPGGIGIWSPDTKYRHDLNDYNNVDQSRLANDILSWTRSHR